MLIPFVTIVVILLGLVLIFRWTVKAWKKSDVLDKKMSIELDNEKEDIIDSAGVNKKARKKQKEKIDDFKQS